MKHQVSEMLRQNANKPNQAKQGIGGASGSQISNNTNNKPSSSSNNGGINKKRFW